MAGSAGFGSPMNWNLLVRCPRLDMRSLLIGQESLEAIAAATPLSVFWAWVQRRAADHRYGNWDCVEQGTKYSAVC